MMVMASSKLEGMARVVSKLEGMARVVAERPVAAGTEAAWVARKEEAAPDT
jgi:hypothetical protein